MRSPAEILVELDAAIPEAEVSAVTSS